MSDSYTAVVNHALFQAQQCLNIADSVQLSQSEFSTLAEASVLFMGTAYYCYLTGIGVRHSISINKNDCAEDLQSRLRERDVVVPELEELISLELTGGSWLSSLLLAHAGLHAVENDAMQGYIHNDNPVIASSNDQPLPLQSANCLAWLEAFNSLLERHRQDCQEW